MNHHRNNNKRKQDRERNQRNEERNQKKQRSDHHRGVERREIVYHSPYNHAHPRSSDYARSSPSQSAGNNNNNYHSSSSSYSRDSNPSPRPYNNNHNNNHNSHTFNNNHNNNHNNNNNNNNRANNNTTRYSGPPVIYRGPQFSSAHHESYGRDNYAQRTTPQNNSYNHHTPTYNNTAPRNTNATPPQSSTQRTSSQSESVEDLIQDVWTNEEDENITQGVLQFYNDKRKWSMIQKSYQFKQSRTAAKINKRFKYLVEVYRHRWNYDLRNKMDQIVASIRRGNNGKCK